jgi:hypothetical protein
MATMDRLCGEHLAFVQQQIVLGLINEWTRMEYAGETVFEEDGEKVRLNYDNWMKYSINNAWWVFNHRN